MVDDKPGIINGKRCADNILSSLTEKVKHIQNRYNLTPTLAIILIGQNPSSIIYVQNKIKAAGKIGIKTIKIELPEDIESSELFNKIHQLNNDPNISGIIIQLPIPKYLDKETILASIVPEKDVDGFNPINVGYLHSNIDHGFIPCTALGCLTLIKKCEPDLSGKHAVIVGRSNIVGKPLSALLLNADCTVTICHSKTKNLSKITRIADIVVIAVGNPLFFTKDYFNNNAIVIDVGISRLFNNKIVGDVDFENVRDKVKIITPVPGGVGPMTVAFLLVNTFKAMINQHQLYGLDYE